ncbi:MAG: LysR family transcriptional regulator, partial [Myxococcales bacterium]|nr:LysR family transcriptional regulator [Myxococcales bacterium]
MDTLGAMRAFVRVVELGSFSAAATELRVEQSTVSKWVAGLESELGTSLLERTT